MNAVAAITAIPIVAGGLLAVLHSGTTRRRTEQGASLLVLLLILLLPFLTDTPSISVLIAALLAAGALAEAAVPGERHRFAQAARQVRLAAMLVALLPLPPLLIWLALAVAGVASAATKLPRFRTALSQLLPCNAALGIALFGAVALQVDAIPLGSVALLLGWGTLVLLDPALLPLVLLLMLRLDKAVVATPFGALVGSMMIAGGLSVLLMVAGILLVRRAPTRYPNFLTLAQGGIALCAFGIGGPEMRLAGLLHLTLLILSRCALLLSSEAGLDRFASLASLSGLPPFGVFPSLALVLFGTAVRMPLLLVPLVAGLIAVGWSSIARLPKDALRLTPSLAWVPLAFALFLGVAMPVQVADWFQAMSETLR